MNYNQYLRGTKEDIKTGLANNIITKEDLNDINCEISRADAAVLLYRLYRKNITTQSEQIISR